MASQWVRMEAMDRLSEALRDFHAGHRAEAPEGDAYSVCMHREDARTVSRTLVNLSVVLGNMDDVGGATDVREELLRRAQAGQGADYPAVAEEIEKLARDLHRNEDFDRAVECNRQVLRIRREMLGDEDPWTLFSLRTGVQLAVKAGHWAEAESLGLECHETHLRVLGEDDSNTALCVELLVKGYEEKGDEEKAAAWRARL